MSELDRYPGAPPGAYVSEEGWLIVGDEAWTEREWRSPRLRRRPTGAGRPVIHDDERHRRDRERKRRAREEAA